MLLIRPNTLEYASPLSGAPFGKYGIECYSANEMDTNVAKRPTAFT